MDNKIILRKRYLEIRNACNGDFLNILKNTNHYINAKIIMTYVSIGSEPDTRALINAAKNDGKRVCVPVTDIANKTISPSFFTALSNGAYSIPEPETLDYCKPEDIDLIIVPGIVFNRDCYRIGYGGGYYDRFLPLCRGVKIGLCYDRCLIDVSFQESCDIPVDCVITETKLIERKQ